MSVIRKWLLVICTILLVNGCAPLRTPVITRNAPIEMYKYVYILRTKVAIIGEIWKSRAKLLRNRLFEKIASVTE